jgi:ABC-type polar amino acid transport system ATPase subunit
MIAANITNAPPEPLTADEQGTTVLSIRNATKEYGRERVLSNITVDIRAGEMLAVIGPSGAGKSTLLRCINRLDELTSGQILFRDHSRSLKRIDDIRGEILRRDIGMVFQEFNLWPNKTILQNVIEAPCHVLKLPKKTAVRMGREWLHRVGIADHAPKYPAELSGGQQQRAAIARALIMNPRVVLFDEITSALDVSTASQILDLIGSLRDSERTYVFVTHHLQFVERYTDRTAVLIEGQLAEIGPSAELVRQPTQTATRQFLNLVGNLS